MLLPTVAGCSQRRCLWARPPACLQPCWSAPGSELLTAFGPSACLRLPACSLLKTVRMVSATGCACTHFSLTRVCQGEHLEQQFVSSWLV